MKGNESTAVIQSQTVQALMPSAESLITAGSASNTKIDDCILLTTPAVNMQQADSSGAVNPVKRGRDRPPGSKNKDPSAKKENSKGSDTTSAGRGLLPTGKSGFKYVARYCRFRCSDSSMEDV